MRVGNTAFHFAGHEQIAQENKLFKETNPKLAEQPVSVSISKEGYENYRSSVQENQQSPTYDQLIEQRKALEDVKYEKNENKFEEDPAQHQKAKSIINEWQAQVKQIKSGNNPVQSADGVNSAKDGIRTASDIMREHSPETADKIGGLIGDFQKTGDKSYLMQASKLALNWLHENYPKHPEWFNGDQ